MSTPIVEIECEERWYDLIAAGVKSVEGRKQTLKWKQLRLGDVVAFVCKENPTERCLVRIVGFTYYAPSPEALRQYLAVETLDRALPGVTTMAEGEAIYLQWSTSAEITKWGFMGLQLEVI